MFKHLKYQEGMALLNIVQKNWGTVVVVVGGTVVAGISAYAIWTRFQGKKTKIQEELSSFIRYPLPREITPRRILVLGLDGSGKSSLLSHISKAEGLKQKPEPTEGFNVVCLNKENEITLNFWEIGGSENLRSYWSNFFHHTDVVVYVVDSTNRDRLEEDKLELQKLHDDKRLWNVPFLVLSNKQDHKDAISIENISNVLSLKTILSSGRHCEILPLQVPVSDVSHSSVEIVKKRIIQYLSMKSYFSVENRSI